MPTVDIHLEAYGEDAFHLHSCKLMLPTKPKENRLAPSAQNLKIKARPAWRQAVLGPQAASALCYYSQGAAGTATVAHISGPMLLQGTATPRFCSSRPGGGALEPRAPTELPF